MMAIRKKKKKKKVEKMPIEVSGPEIKIMHLTKGATQQIPDQIIIHAMMERIEGMHAVDFLKLIGLSVHAMVTPDGKIIRCREDNEGAYHAKGHNTNSLGVEFLIAGEGTYPVFLSAIQKGYLDSGDQYYAGVYLIKEWIKEHEIKDVSTHRYLSPGRKFDPGTGFPYKRFEKDIGVQINDIG